MEINKVKLRLTLLYTGSLLLILILFILVLYLFISNAINKQEIEELEQFYEKENHEFIEELFKNYYGYGDIRLVPESKRKKRMFDEYEEEEHDEFDDDEYEEIEPVKYRPERDIFYYVFDENSRLIEGEGTIRGFEEYFEETDFDSPASKIIREIEWEKVHILYIYYPLQVDGQNIGSVMVGKNITDEKHLIQRIIWILLFLTVFFSLLFALAGNFFAGQAMKPILKAYEKQRKFVSDASHELRTPLSVFYSSIDVLSSEEEENLSPFGKQVLEDVKQEAEMMHKLLDDLLFLARHDQGNFKLELEEFDLSSMVHSLLNRFKRILPSQLTLQENIENGIQIKADKVRIQQLLYILLDNAARYTKEGSITCSLAAQGEKIVLSVKDTGIGISPKDLEHIFERFYRGDESRKRNGTGLGLAIAKTIVEAHGGEIAVKSEVGKGTEFLIKLNKH
ncbi:sensor histidine kinase [Ureibacillus thermophilus]|uniref:sensor histidine kinase n=1 Tax=Ureibacillus thermophilus TaxID=367743 RepID=UPI00360947F7